MNTARNRLHSLKSSALAALLTLTLTLVPLSTSCRAFGGISDDEALRTIRDLSRNGKLPPEAVVLDIENRFSRSKVGALAKLMRARIRFEAGDFNTAAAILESSAIDEYTTLADYALWIRGRSYQSAGNHNQAVDVLKKLVDSQPRSTKSADAKIAWAASAIEVGRAADVPPVLSDLVSSKNLDAMLLLARSFKLLGVDSESSRLLREIYFSGFGGDTSKRAGTSLEESGQSLLPQNADEIRAKAEARAKSGNAIGALEDYAAMIASDPSAVTPEIQLQRLQLLVSVNRLPEAEAVFSTLPKTATERETALYRLVGGFIKTKNWQQVRGRLRLMWTDYPSSGLLPKAFIEAGNAARDARVKSEESYFFGEALSRFPERVEVAGAQFELAWLEHEAGRYDSAASMLIEHLARYTDRDTTFRGRAGYWAARNAERANRISEACAIYEALTYRYSANWYGHLGLERLNAMRGSGQCLAPQSATDSSALSVAIRNLKKVTVAPERSSEREAERIAKASDLSSVGLFDWAEAEIQDAHRTAGSSPRVSMAAASCYRLKGDNTGAFLALAKSYPDYAQMFPEEMSKEEWSIFYPLTNWNEISFWAGQRGLDPFKVAGLIRQESVFNPRAKSSANALGLMQLLLSTARLVAKKYNASTAAVFADNLYDPALNIELGTAYMKDQLEKYGRIEYMAAAYNAGPGRVSQWRNSLPLDIDEFVEEIPFRETRMYVQGVVRNTAQYRRLYDENGNFRSNVGTRPLRAEMESKSAEQLAQEFPEVSVADRGEE